MAEQGNPQAARSTAKLKVLDLVSEGEIEGLVNGLASVYLDGTPVASDSGSPQSLNFQGVIVAERTGPGGSPEQSYIPGFDQLESVVNVGTEVTQSGGGVTRQVSTSEVDAVRVVIRFPQGIQEIDQETGDTSKTTVDFAIDTRPDGGSFSEAMTPQVTAFATNPYETSLRIQRPEGSTGLWDIRVRRTTADSESNYLQNASAWARFVEIQESVENYPGVAYFGTIVNIESTGSRIPERAYEIKGIKVRVPSNYDPSTRVYTGNWDGTFKTAWTDNPAWILYDLLTNTTYGLGDEIDESNIDKFSFYAASQYNDQMVEDGTGGSPITYEPRFTFNGLLNTWQQAQHWITTVASSMNAVVVKGSTIYVDQDRPAEPVKLVTNANVIDGQFSYASSGLDTRQTVANITFNDKDDNYLPKTITVSDQDGIDRYGAVVTDLAAIGVTSEGQARRKGKHWLYTQLNQLDMVTYRCGFNQADLVPGDIIKVMDNDYAGADYAGRISGGDIDTVILDREVELNPAATYTIDVLDADGETIISREVDFSGSPAVTNTINIIGSPELPTSAADLLNREWMLYSDDDVVPREFRVKGISEVETGIYEISAVQHDPNKYDTIEGDLLNPDTPIFSLYDSRNLPPVTNITFEETEYTDPQFGDRVGIRVTWDPPDTEQIISGYSIQWRLAGWSEPIFVTTEEYVIENSVPGDYDVTIWPVSVQGREGRLVEDSHTFSPTGNNSLNPPTSLLLKPGTGSGTSFTTPGLHLVITPDTDNDAVSGYKWFFYRSGSPNLIHESFTNRNTLTNTFPFDLNEGTDGGPHREIEVEVYTVDAQGRLSTTAANDTFTNSQNAAPSVTTETAPNGTFVKVDPAAQTTDITGVVICQGTSDSFTPASGNVVYEGPDFTTLITSGVFIGETRYYKAAVTDAFGYDSISDLNFNGTGVSGTRDTPGIGIFDTLPAENAQAYPEGTLVFLTTNEKLYRSTGGGSPFWVQATANDLSELEGTIDLASQVSGTLTASFAESGLINSNVTINADGSLSGAGGGQASLNSLPGDIAETQIEDDSISTPKLQATAVEAGNIAASAVTTVKLDALAVTAAKIAAGSIETDKLAANAVTAAKIEAGTITANEINAGAITTDKLDAGSVTAAKLSVTNLQAVSTDTGSLTVTGDVELGTNGRIIFDNGTYMKVSGLGFGSSNQFVEWFGPSGSIGACDEESGIFFLRIDGTAHYGGSRAVDVGPGNQSTSFGTYSGFCVAGTTYGSDQFGPFGSFPSRVLNGNVVVAIVQHEGSGDLFFEFEGEIADDALHSFDRVIIDGQTFNRTSASYSFDSPSDKTRWLWAGVSSPIFSDGQVEIFY